MTVTTPDADIDTREVTAASTSHEKDTSNLVNNSIDRNNKPKSSDMRKSELVSGGLTGSIRMPARLMIYLGPAEGQADDMSASETGNNGLDRNATSGRSAGGWVKLIGKKALDLVAEVSDAFPPLKGAAAGLKYIIENVEASDQCLFHLDGCHLNSNSASSRQSKGRREYYETN